MAKNKKYHRGEIHQIPIFLGKFFRMFVYQDDWKVVPMSAVIAALVGYVIHRTMFVSMEGTLKGALATACVCVWNGCFNSIQVVCRERGIVKREHRSGMHITAYIFSHMVYQAFLCLLQVIVLLVAFSIYRMQFPAHGILLPVFLPEFGATLFLITYAADMLSLLISCIAKTTTAAMTLMPFLLIFELVFSGSMFSLSGTAEQLTNLSVAKWGIQCICAEADYNNLPANSAWSMLRRFDDVEISGEKPIEEILDVLEDQGLKEWVCEQAGKNSQREEYAATDDNVKNCWFALILFSLVEAAASVIVLKRIDKDRR